MKVRNKEHIFKSQNGQKESKESELGKDFQTRTGCLTSSLSGADIALCNVLLYLCRFTKPSVSPLLLLFFNGNIF